jgi:hypothetical protein
MSFRQRTWPLCCDRYDFASAVVLYVPRDAFRLLFPLPVPSACLRAAAPSLAPSQGDELLFTSNTPTIRRATLPLSSHQPTVSHRIWITTNCTATPPLLHLLLSFPFRLSFSTTSEKKARPHIRPPRDWRPLTRQIARTRNTHHENGFIHSMSYYNKASEARNGYDENYDLVSALSSQVSLVVSSLAVFRRARWISVEAVLGAVLYDGLMR